MGQDRVDYMQLSHGYVQKDRQGSWPAQSLGRSQPYCGVNRRVEGFPQSLHEMKEVLSDPS